MLLSVEPTGPVFPIFTGTAAQSGGTSANNLALDAAGNFVAVYWAGNNLSGALYARRFNADGTPRGPAVVVAQNASDSSVALRPDGGYVVTWGFVQPWARVFNGSDQPLTDAFEVAPRLYYSGGTSPNVATDAEGNFVVAWDDVPESGERTQVFARRFDAAGKPLGDPFFVNSEPNTPAGGQGRSTAAMAPGGHFALAWDNGGLDEGEYVFARFGDPEGNFTGDDFPLAQEGLGTLQSGVDVAVAANGNFLFVWQEHPFGSFQGQVVPWEVQGRWFDSSGAPLGPDMSLRRRQNEVGTEFGSYDIATDAAGDSFVIAWEQPFFATANPLQVVAQVFDREGHSKGAAFPVSPAPEMAQQGASVSMDADGDFVVTFTEGPKGLEVGSTSVLGRRFSQRPVPAAVAQVFVGGSSWTSAFKEKPPGASEYGFAVPAGDQTNELPWSGIDQVSIAFTKNVRVDFDDLQIAGVNVPVYAPDPDLFTYDVDTHTATWRLPRPFAGDRITLRLRADGLGGIATPDGLALDGDWTNPAGSAAGADAFPSGDGAAGGDFTFRLNVLPGDVTRNGAVNALDLADVKRRLSRSTATNVGAGYTPFADANGDGRINELDLLAVKQRLNRSLPAVAAFVALPPPLRGDGGDPDRGFMRNLLPY